MQSIEGRGLGVCHLCRGALRQPSHRFSGCQVTSDCKPFFGFQPIYICTLCGTVQKNVTSDYLRVVDSVYRGYTDYVQSSLDEARFFRTGSPTVLPRSRFIADWIKRQGLLGEIGDMLEVGCGNGTFLKAFSFEFPKWRLHGNEVEGRKVVMDPELSPSVEFYAGDIQNYQTRFDFIAMIHCLEHIPDPYSFLCNVRDRLTANGFLFIQVPNIITSPFDLAIVDHCSHFCPRSLNNLLHIAGFDVVTLAPDNIPKELSLIARRRHEVKDRSKLGLVGKGDLHIEAGFRLMSQFFQQSIQVTGEIGVLGTGIPGTWLASSLHQRVSFFVDEDPSRIGGEHLTLKIFSPQDAPKGIPVVIPLRLDLARSVYKRLKSVIPSLVAPPDEEVDSQRLGRSDID